MTTTDVRITRPEEYEVLRRYAAGMDITTIVKDTRQLHEDVNDVVLHMAHLQRGRARQLVRDYLLACQQKAAGVQCTDPPPPVKTAPRVRVITARKETPRAITPPAATPAPPAVVPAVEVAAKPVPARPTAEVKRRERVIATGRRLVAASAPTNPAVVAPEPVLPAAVVDELHAAGLPTRVMYACTRCPGRYRHPYSDHGAPKRCPGRLLRVEVRDA